MRNAVRVLAAEWRRMPPAVQRLRKRFLSKRRIHYLLDLTVLVAAFLLAYLLRFDFAVPRSQFTDLFTQLPYVVLIQMAALTMAGVYAFIWRYVGMSESRAFFKAALWSLIPILFLRLVLPREWNDWSVPLSIIVLDHAFGFGGVLGLRLIRRVIWERKERRRWASTTVQRPKSVLLIGAGRAGMLAAKEIKGRGDVNLLIKGFIDDDKEKTGSMVQGVRVLGTTAELPRLVRELNIDHVILTIAQASRRDVRRIVTICEQLPIKVRVIPGLSELLRGAVEVNHMRDIQIEDLLGREPVVLDLDGINHFLGGKVVMVTGAGGSIGSELARQAARFEPSCILLVERAEPLLFAIDRELREPDLKCRLIPLVADIGDATRLRQIMAKYRPQIILHAAAHKHVPMMETNSVEAIKNNVLATYTLGSLAGEFGVESFVLISTDKAVRPTSIMGASKRLAELIIQSLDQRFATRYVAVRFGNVIGSTGSVIPIFREQISKGGPVTVTHQGMMRYFMTIPEAAQLVLQAGGIGEGGEIFVLDMGEPIRIVDLALDTITLSGLKPYEDIDIVVTGIRPGEKLFEELAVTEERLTKTRHPKIYIGQIVTYPQERVLEAMKSLKEFAQGGEEQSIRSYLVDFLPEADLNGNGHAQKKSKEPVQVIMHEQIAIQLSTKEIV
jgi:FlaA1/EpsC-like NDP-sugar epimerase